MPTFTNQTLESNLTPMPSTSKTSDIFDFENSTPATAQPTSYKSHETKKVHACNNTDEENEIPEKESIPKEFSSETGSPADTGKFFSKETFLT